MYNKRNNKEGKKMSKDIIGRVCIKLTGREAGKKCIIVDKLESSFVLIDGNVKRRKCNISHLELTDKILKIKKKDSTEAVQKAMKEAKIKVTTKKGKEAKPKPKKIRKTKIKPEKTKKEVKKVKKKSNDKK